MTARPGSEVRDGLSVSNIAVQSSSGLLPVAIVVPDHHPVPCDIEQLTPNGHQRRRVPSISPLRITNRNEHIKVEFDSALAGSEVRHDGASSASCCQIKSSDEKKGRTSTNQQR